MAIRPGWKIDLGATKDHRARLHELDSALWCRRSTGKRQAADRAMKQAQLKDRILRHEKIHNRS